MRRWMGWLVVLMLALALAPRPALAQGPEPIIVAADQVVQGDLAAVGRPLLIAGRVEGDVTSWSSSITILGTVNGDVVSYAGHIKLGPDAHVTGNILALGGGVTRTNPTQVAGRVLGEQVTAGGLLLADMAMLFRPGSDGELGNIPLPLVSFVLTLLGLLLTLACATVWPHRTLGVSRVLQQAPARSALLGVLTTLLLALIGLVVAGLLALTLIGLPLLLPLFLLLQTPYLFALAGVARSVATRIRLPESSALILGTALLLIPLGMVGAIAPLWSLVLFYLLASIGLGATILSRGGAYALSA
ncbi:polymer-forming cytoskeletal protein [Candidatus Oscillochloris fontis]|uniref:polymer-forming cytoskeletal protein n=1 Tax=Candidatus Oscillochloris fontis TaxID=2496868 RepID=UPI00101C702B|nr:polymer-forming cytoskeletal protein [Candidatus Oscillochloris fontis]